MKNIFICVKKTKILAIFAIILMFSVHFGLYFSLSSYQNVVNSVGNRIFNSFNREEISQNDSDIFFVSSANVIKLAQKIDSLLLPSEEKFEQNGGELNFSIKTNFVIKSAGYGIVTKVGTQENGLKYVEIKHSGEFSSRYENLKTVGVGKNFVIKSSSVIGSASERENFVFKVLKNGEVFSSYQIESGEIRWAN